MAAFGVGPQDGIYVDPSDLRRARDPAGALSDDIHAIRTRYCLPSYRRRTPFNFSAANGTQTVDAPNNLINAFTITVVTGTVSVWVGSQTGQSGLGLPDYQFGPGTTTQIFLPPYSYEFTLQSTGGAASGVFTPMAV